MMDTLINPSNPPISIDNIVSSHNIATWRHKKGHILIVIALRIVRRHIPKRELHTFVVTSPSRFSLSEFDITTSRHRDKP
jgi:hypothetical protein